MISKFIFNNQYLLNDLPDCDKERLEDAMKVRNIRKNEAIFTDGTNPNGIFYVKKGRIKKYKVDNDGKEQIFYIYNSGEFFGYSSILSEKAYNDSTLAIENSVIAMIPKEDFLNILNTSDIFSKLLLKSLSNEFRVMTNLVAVLSQRTVRERVALCLLILHYKYTSDQESFYITLSRSDLANMVGTVNETLGRVLHDFRKENLIYVEGRKIQLINLDKISSIAKLY